MHKKFDSQAIEKKWQQIWKEEGIYNVGPRDASKEKEYVLVEWPYPSGNLHIGHWYAFAVPDIYVRFMRMKGKQVLFPMGFDAFGLPAENAAIKRNLNPKNWTNDNIAYMKDQLASMGNAFSWDKTTSSTDPQYYKWTQWMFTQFFENNIAYRGKGIVNWCPGCNTVIANEQVLANDTCERCGSAIEKREMPQWMLRITKYADRLTDDLDALDWPEHIKEAQRQWIGRSKGAEIEFKLKSKVKRKALIIHGFAGDPSGAWKPWLKSELEARGYEVRSPKLPNFDHPEFEETMKFLLEQVRDFTKNDIVVGHSLGGHFALKLAELIELNKVVVVAPTIGGLEMPYEDWQKENPEGDYESCRRILENHPVEFGKLKTQNKVAIFGEKDRGIPLTHAKQLDSSWSVIIKPDTGHMSHEVEVAEILSAALDKVTVFTTRPDTLFGATYLVLAPEHALVAQNEAQISNWSEVADYITVSKQKDEQDRLDATKEKTGVRLEGITATNPASGEEIPVYISDYVLATYGTGAIMAVPAHDERDNAFAQKFDCLILDVIKPSSSSDTISEIYTANGTLINSREFDGMDSEDAKVAITEKVGGKMTSTYRLRDWSIGRQRYWGVPIPIVYDPEGKAHVVPKEHLPWLLPEDVDFKPTGVAPLAKSEELKKRTESIFGKGWTPEVETMDTFVDSSWYFLRYLDSSNDLELASKAKQKDWMQVDMYFGGAEHTTMHLLYSRFWQKALLDLGLVNDSEPYKRRINRGLILGPDGNKMSKSKGNVIDPDEQVKKVGADTVKMYLAFMGPYEGANYPFDLGGIAGVRRFLERVYGLSEHIKPESSTTTKLLHKTIKKVQEDIVTFKFNTAISAMMIFVNQAEKDGLTKNDYHNLLQILAPFAPHVTEELWQEAGNQESIHLSALPTFDESLAANDTVTIGVQINGKLRGDITISPTATETEAMAELANNLDLQKRLERAKIRKTIFVAGRILNLIVDETK